MKRYFRLPNGQLVSREEDESALFSGLASFDNPRSFMVGADWDDDDDDDEFDDLLFAGQPDLFAAMKRHKRTGREGKGKRKKLRMMALARAAGGFSFPARGDGYGMDLALPFATTVAAGGTANLQLKPQDEFGVHELIIASQNAQLANIQTFKVGTQDQFVGKEGALNGDIVSSQTNRNIGFKGTIANPGILIYLDIDNADPNNAQTFYGVIKGPTVRYGDRVAG